MDSTIIASIIGLFGVIFTSLFGIFMHHIGTKSEKVKVIMNKRIDLYIELSGKLQSLQRSLNIFTTLRLRNKVSSPYNTADLNRDLEVFDKFVSEYYDYFKENSGIIKLFCTKLLVEKLEQLKDDIIRCRDEYQMIIEGDWGDTSQVDYSSTWIMAVYRTDMNMYTTVLPAISKSIDEIIQNLSKDLK